MATYNEIIYNLKNTIYGGVTSVNGDEFKITAESYAYNVVG